MIRTTRPLPVLRRTAGLAIAAAVALSACSKDTGTPSEPQGPNLPGNPTENPQFRAASFIFDVNTNTKTVKITAPSGSVINASIGADGKLTQREGGPDLSIVTGDVVELTTANYQSSVVGAFEPGKVRVSFDVNVTNKISSIELITPTFPQPPAGTSGILLFPFSTNVVTSSGGTSVGGDGTEVLVEQPSYGAVRPSIDWDGAPFNFFNDDASCSGTSGGGSAGGSPNDPNTPAPAPDSNSDCYRFQAFVAPLLGGATSEGQRVGFDIDPTVGSFRARLIVAADIRAGSGTPSTGSIAGTVSSNLPGQDLSGITATTVASGVSYTDATDAAGAFSILDVPVGSRTVSIALPASLTSLGCTITPPSSRSVTVPLGGPATPAPTFAINCPTPSFTLSGLVRTNGSPFAGATIVATPAGGSGISSAPTGAAGTYSVLVPVGTGAGAIAVNGIPAGCTAAAGNVLTYSGATLGATITRNYDFTCPLPGPNGLRGTWTVTGSTAALRIAINVAATDPVASLQAKFDPPAGLTYTGRSIAGNVFGSDGNGSLTVPSTLPASGIIVISGLRNGGVDGPPVVGNDQLVVTLNFNITAPAGTTFTFPGRTAALGSTPADGEFIIDEIRAENLTLQTDDFLNNVVINSLTP